MAIANINSGRRLMKEIMKISIVVLILNHLKFLQILYLKLPVFFQTILANQTHERKVITEAAKKYADYTGKVSFDNETILIVSKK
jgi:hypothetical protein